MADGHLNKCKECTKSDVKSHRDNNIEKVRAYDRYRYHHFEHRQELSRECGRRAVRDGRAAAYNRVARERNPEKYKARCAVNNAIRDGRLERGAECERCGTTVRLQAHHDDYSKPLDVRWLCPACHGSHHTEQNNIKRSTV